MRKCVFHMDGKIQAGVCSLHCRSILSGTEHAFTVLDVAARLQRLRRYVQQR